MSTTAVRVTGTLARYERDAHRVIVQTAHALLAIELTPHTLIREGSRTLAAEALGVHLGTRVVVRVRDTASGLAAESLHLVTRWPDDDEP